MLDKAKKIDKALAEKLIENQKDCGSASCKDCRHTSDHANFERVLNSSTYIYGNQHDKNVHKC
jgi:hypothetical protein